MSIVSVLGSINVDLSVKVPRFLNPGETISGSYFFTSEGGKGANQAVALAKLGGNVVMLGKVGADIYGKQYLDYFEKLRMNSKAVESVQGVSTGVALITINNDGQNTIAVVAGANNSVDSAYIDRCKDTILNSQYLLMQLEIPLETVLKAKKLTSGTGVKVILDPAPASPLPEEIYEDLYCITPNETETFALTGIKIYGADDAQKAGAFFLSKGVKNVVIKAGENGSYIFNSSCAYYVPCYNVKVKDTTAAGDTFNGAFTYGLIKNMPLQEAVLFANAASAIKIQGLGAQKAMPAGTDEVEQLMRSQPHKHPVSLFD